MCKFGNLVNIQQLIVPSSIASQPLSHSHWLIVFVPNESNACQSRSISKTLLKECRPIPQIYTWSNRWARLPTAHRMRLKQFFLRLIRIRNWFCTTADFLFSPFFWKIVIASVIGSFSCEKHSTLFSILNLLCIYRRAKRRGRGGFVCQIEVEILMNFIRYAINEMEIRHTPEFTRQTLFDDVERQRVKLDPAILCAMCPPISLVEWKCWICHSTQHWLRSGHFARIEFENKKRFCTFNQHVQYGGYIIWWRAHGDSFS